MACFVPVEMVETLFNNERKDTEGQSPTQGSKRPGTQGCSISVGSCVDGHA